MHYSYNYTGESEEGFLAMVIFYVIYGIFAGGSGIALYVFRSLGVYSIAKRRGLNRAWFAWVPVADNYLLGCLSDQYQYVVKGKNKSKRKWLLGLSIALTLLGIVVLVMTVGTAVTFMGNAMVGFSNAKLEKMVLSAVLGLLGSCVPLAGVAVAVSVIRYIALYDVYVSLDPRNSVMYTVLSILFSVTEPFFLFFNRKKDDGMPPRREPEAPAAEEPLYE